MLKDIRTKSIVLRRTNYGESDRILNLLTENGVISVIAHGVRKEKSKLAGGIELFCVSDITYYEGRNNDLHTLTSAKMLEYYDKIPVDLNKLELGSLFLKQINKSADNIDGPDYFNLAHQALSALNSTNKLGLIEAWFWFNLARLNGEQINLYRDVDENALDEKTMYVWDNRESALRPQRGGNIGEKEIKMMRLILSSELKTVLRVENTDIIVPSILYIAKAINKI
ncbi:DNA repair protein RecO [Candidatus Saccharibacteria bacterium]|nr:DNA repair protein RecO [Candidatus Saccharibacteria bacterium]